MIFLSLIPFQPRHSPLTTSGIRQSKITKEPVWIRLGEKVLRKRDGLLWRVKSSGVYRHSKIIKQPVLAGQGEKGYKCAIIVKAGFVHVRKSEIQGLFKDFQGHV